MQCSCLGIFSHLQNFTRLASASDLSREYGMIKFIPLADQDLVIPLDPGVQVLQPTAARAACAHEQNPAQALAAQQPLKGHRLGQAAAFPRQAQRGPADGGGAPPGSGGALRIVI